MSGRVQGVFFRQACKQQADGLGVSGVARNLDDGRVEIVVEGDVDAVEQLVAWCRTGPSHALVTRVEVRNEPPEGLVGFRTA